MATVRVQEKLAINPGPTDAVLTAIHCLSGDVVLLPDGSFWSGATITMEMRRLSSDSSLRDTWVELFGPQTRRYPTAELVPERAEGLPSPMPAAGTWNVTLQTRMKVHNVSHPVRWDATVSRETDGVRVTARTVVLWSDFAIDKPTLVPEVASVADEIRLEVAFVAREQP